MARKPEPLWGRFSGWLAFCHKAYGSWELLSWAQWYDVWLHYALPLSVEDVLVARLVNHPPFGCPNMLEVARCR